MVEAKETRRSTVSIDQRLQDFVYHKKVGKGSFGMVFFATDTKKGQAVAIKKLDKAYISRKNKIEAVMREKKILALLSGRPFIIDLYSTHQDDDTLYFVFEHCHYGTLSNLITLKEKLSYDLCV